MSSKITNFLSNKGIQKEEKTIKFWCTDPKEYSLHSSRVSTTFVISLWVDDVLCRDASVSDTFPSTQHPNENVWHTILRLKNKRNVFFVLSQCLDNKATSKCWKVNYRECYSIINIIRRQKLSSRGNFFFVANIFLQNTNNSVAKRFHREKSDKFLAVWRKFQKVPEEVWRIFFPNKIFPKIR